MKNKLHPHFTFPISHFLKCVSLISHFTFLISVLFLLSACSRTYHEQSYEYPAWTPDGKIVYWYADYYINRADFLGSLQGTSGGTSLHIMDADGNNDKKLFDAPSYGTFHLSVSADGTKILNGGQILDLTTGQELAKNEDVYPGDWSPDGKKIVFVKGTIKIWDVSSNVVTDTGLEGVELSWKYNNYFIYRTKEGIFVNNVQTNIKKSMSGIDAQYTKDGNLILSVVGGYEKWDITTDTKISSITNTNSYIAPYLFISPTGDKLIWNTTETPTRKSIWIENIDGTGRACLKESK